MGYIFSRCNYNAKPQAERNRSDEEGTILGLDIHAETIAVGVTERQFLAMFTQRERFVLLVGHMHPLRSLHSASKISLVASFQSVLDAGEPGSEI